MTDSIQKYKGKDIDVTYNVELCIHAAECTQGLPEVFDTEKRPWIRPDKGNPEDISSVAQKCPSGALHFERKDGKDNEKPDEVNSIEIQKNGPLYARGDIKITDMDGNILFRDTRLALCRCGASKNKPFCDNSHLEINFLSDEGMENEYANDPSDNGNEPLTIKLRPNGPIFLEGQFEIRGSENTLIFTGNKAKLCRCGASNIKPFCDGTHRTINFQTG